MPAARVVAERPTKTRDSPTLGTRFVKEFLAEAEISEMCNADLLRISGQFVFTRNVVTRDVPPVRTHRLFSLRLGFGVVVIKNRHQQNTDANQRCERQSLPDKLCSFFQFVIHNRSL